MVEMEAEVVVVVEMEAVAKEARDHLAHRANQDRRGALDTLDTLVLVAVQVEAMDHLAHRAHQDRRGTLDTLDTLVLVALQVPANRGRMVQLDLMVRKGLLGRPVHQAHQHSSLIGGGHTRCTQVNVHRM